MNTITFIIFISYGMFFTLTLLINAKPHLLWGKKRLVFDGIEMSAKSVYVPFLLFVFFTFIIFTVFRDSSVGTDYMSYKSMFDSAAGISLSKYISRQMIMGGEPLYSFVSYFVKALTNNYFVLLFIIYTIIFFTQITLFSRTTSTLVAFIVYLILYFPVIFESFNTMRNNLSAFIAIWGYSYLGKKKLFPALIIFIIATLIHYTALFCFLVFFVCIICNKNYFSVRKLMFITLSGITVLVISIPVLVNYMISIKAIYSVYLDEGGGISIRTNIFYIVVFIISLIYSKKLIAHNSFNRIMIIVVVAAIITVPLQSLTSIFARLFLFSHVAIFFLVSEIFVTLRMTKRNYFFILSIFSVIIILSLGWFYSHVVIIPHDYGITDYKNMLF